DTLTKEIIDHLGGSLVGLYLYGSLVVGDFDVQRSDIDLLAVTRSLLTPETESAIAEMHHSLVQRFPEWRDRLEVGYFPTPVMRDFEEPLEDVHRISPGEPFHRTPALPHWLTDLYSVQEHGSVLYGPPVADVLPTISPSRFRAAIQRVVAEWREWVLGVQEQQHQAYVRLTMFRSLYGFRYARQTSKVAAAHWFAAEFPEWSRDADQAVEWRQRGSAIIDLPSAQRTVRLVHLVHDLTHR
ncbi:MAG: aminoglycoside adenylyltransferase domain-containing protein, partial [Nocardioides sp.]